MQQTDIQHLKKNRAFIAIALTCIMGWLCSWLAFEYFFDYAWGLFIWLPLVMGAASTMIYGYKNRVQNRQLLFNSILSLLFYCFGLLVFAWEGIVCLVMAAPFVLFFNMTGHYIGLAIIKSKRANHPVSIVLLFISVPVFMAFENRQKEDEQLRSVVTSIEINASPEEVWKNVIAFPQLKEPEEFIFKTGIAYPVDATIKGQGVGAVRHCNFSTGSFVEPITVWDPPRLLKFSVEEQPVPMKELSFYDVQPNHLHGYWVSKQGQFKIIPLANGNTLLEGTTWYVNKIKPDFYWTLWSDYIVHKIHNRVLEHIKSEAERKVD